MFNDPWPQDWRLDPFRDAVWEPSREGQVEAYLTCQVIRMRSFPLLWIKREWLWYQINWLDGRQDQPQEDYGPGWLAVAELEQGRFDDDGGMTVSSTQSLLRDRIETCSGRGSVLRTSVSP